MLINIKDAYIIKSRFLKNIYFVNMFLHYIKDNKVLSSKRHIPFSYDTDSNRVKCDITNLTFRNEDNSFSVTVESSDLVNTKAFINAFNKISVTVSDEESKQISDKLDEIVSDKDKLIDMALRTGNKKLFMDILNDNH